jgi:hypothetical protein
LRAHFRQRGRTEQFALREGGASALPPREFDVRLARAPAAAIATHADAIPHARAHHQQCAQVTAEHVDTDIEAASRPQRGDLRGLPQEAQHVAMRPVLDQLVVPGRVDLDDFVDERIVLEYRTSPTADAGDHARRRKTLLQRFEEWGRGEQLAEIVRTQHENLARRISARIKPWTVEPADHPDRRFDQQAFPTHCFSNMARDYRRPRARGVDARPAA